MDFEFETTATIDGAQVPVSVQYDTDGIVPLIYGIFLLDEYDTDVTNEVSEIQFDRIFDDISRGIAENMICEAEFISDMKRENNA